MNKFLQTSFAMILGAIGAILVGTATAEELEEVAFDEVSPYWEKQEEQWRPSRAMAQQLVDGLEPGDTAEIEVTFRIDRNGEVEDIQVVEATHGGIMEDMTRDRLNHMEFRPGQENPEGMPVIVRFENYFNRH